MIVTRFPPEKVETLPFWRPPCMEPFVTVQSKIQEFVTELFAWYVIATPGHCPKVVVGLMLICEYPVIPNTKNIKMIKILFMVLQLSLCPNTPFYWKQALSNRSNSYDEYLINRLISVRRKV